MMMRVAAVIGALVAVTSITSIIRKLRSKRAEEEVEEEKPPQGPAQEEEQVVPIPAIVPGVLTAPPEPEEPWELIPYRDPAIEELPVFEFTHMLATYTVLNCPGSVCVIRHNLGYVVQATGELTMMAVNRATGKYLWFSGITEVIPTRDPITIVCCHQATLTYLPPSFIAEVVTKDVEAGVVQETLEIAATNFAGVGVELPLQVFDLQY